MEPSLLMLDHRVSKAATVLSQCITQRPPNVAASLYPLRPPAPAHVLRGPAHQVAGFFYASIAIP